jgi:predicted RNase H-like HicB family nuclease
MPAQAKIPVRIYHDDDTRTWHFHVPELHIVGGGQRTHDEAREAAAEAIAFVLESQLEPEQGEGLEYLDVAVG